MRFKIKYRKHYNRYIIDIHEDDLKIMPMSASDSAKIKTLNKSKDPGKMTEALLMMVRCFYRHNSIVTKGKKDKSWKKAQKI
jgi:hypothetical protein